MECHLWFEVSDRRKIRFRNVQIKVLLVFEQGRPLQVSTIFDNFDQFQPVLTSFDQFWPVSTSFDQFWLVSIDTIQDTIVYGITQLWLSIFFRGGSLLLPTSVLLNGIQKLEKGFLYFHGKCYLTLGFRAWNSIIYSKTSLSTNY